MDELSTKKKTCEKKPGKEILQFIVCLGAPNDSISVTLLCCTHMHVYIC